MHREVFADDGLAHTLRPEEVAGPTWDGGTGEYTFTHPNGWTITGIVHEDYYCWVNDFSATHPKYGWVKGNFETEVTARSKRGYDNFVKNHEPHTWDYGDI